MEDEPLEESTSSSLLSESFQSRRANLDACYRNIKENKVTKENVWTNHFIDDFRHMVSRHHNVLGNFQRVGSFLEASSRIYELKVDSVHSDIIRLSSGIRRQNVIQPTAEILDESVTSEYTSRPSNRDSPIRRRPVKTTVVGNSQLINAKLQTYEQPNCLLKLKVMENNVKSKNLLQNLLPSNKYTLSLQLKNKFWDNREAPANELDDDDDVVNSASVDLPDMNWIPSTADVIRSKITGYEISNTPCEHFRYSTTVENVNQLYSEDNELSDHSSMELQFDMNVDVVPPHPVILQPVIMDDPMNTDDDLNALQRCSVLRRKTIVDDLRPLTSSPLEYSYRRFTDEQISNASNHWKVPSVTSNRPDNTEKNKKRRRRKKDEPVVLSNANNESIEEKFFSLDDPMAKTIRNACHEKWDAKNLKMPSVMSLPSLRSLAPLITDCLATHQHTDSVDVDETESITSDSIFDHVDSVSNLIDDDALIPNEVNDDFINEPISEPAFLTHPLQQMQITPPYVNVKRITKKCLELICACEGEGREASYSFVYHQLQNNDQFVTPALVFSSILQLANENNFHLNRIGENDFLIKRI